MLASGELSEVVVFADAGVEDAECVVVAPVFVPVPELEVDPALPVVVVECELSVPLLLVVLAVVLAVVDGAVVVEEVVMGSTVAVPLVEVVAANIGGGVPEVKKNSSSWNATSSRARTLLEEGTHRVSLDVCEFSYIWDDDAFNGVLRGSQCQTMGLSYGDKHTMIPSEPRMPVASAEIAGTMQRRIEAFSTQLTT